MTASGTEGRSATTPELFRDFESILDARLKEERQKRRQADRFARISMGIAAAALLASALIAYTLYDRRGPGISAGVVRTRELSLMDASGRVRGRWSMQAEGGTRLSFLDERGIERMRLTLLHNGSQGITLADSRGEARVVLSLEGGEGSRLTFADAAGRPRTVLGLSPQQAGSLVFADQESTPRAALGLAADGRATFVLPADRRAREAPPDTTDSESSELLP